MGKSKSSTDSEKKNDVISAIFKIDLHCVGCVNRIVKYAKSIHGVESVTTEFEANKLIVNGRMDPVKVKTKLQLKTRKKVDLISPQPNKKDKEDNSKKNSNEKTDLKKPKELQVTTATLKLQMHCQGCIDKIKKVVSRTKGVLDMTIDEEKDHVIVRGTMDVKSLVECLKDRLRRNVEVAPLKKEKEGGGDSKGKSGGGGDEVKKEKKKKGEEVNGKRKDGDNNGNKLEFISVSGYGVVPVVNHGSQFVYGYDGYNDHLHAHQMFNNENHNTCSIM